MMTDRLPYVSIDGSQDILERPDMLSTPCEPVSFPLSEENAHILAVLEAQFDDEKNCAGLAAPQIGFHKRMIVFAAPDDALVKKWRKDHSQFMNKTIWMNPSYEPVGDDMAEDMEACFSVRNVAGNVSRYTHIRYKAQTPTGKTVTGEATGFLARLIQHEIDHTDGILFTEKVIPGTLVNLDDYRNKRAKVLEEA